MRIFNQSLHLGYCPAHFRESTTVVLRKPGKDNYAAPKSYRPIALMNTIGKIMDAVIARRLSYLARLRFESIRGKAPIVFQVVDTGRTDGELSG